MKKNFLSLKKIAVITCFICFISIGFFAYSEEIKVETLAKTSSSWDGEKLPAYKQGDSEVTILKFTIPPGASLPLHSHPVINAGVLLKGKLTVKTQKGGILNLEAGDSIVEVVDTLHYGTNPGTEYAEIIVFYAGVKGCPVTIKVKK